MGQLTVVVSIADPELNARVLRALANLPVRAVMKPLEELAEDLPLDERSPRQARFDVVFLDAMAPGERLLDLVRTLKKSAAPPAVVTVHPTADTEGLLAAIRAGADDCLYPPVHEAEVRQVFERVVEKRERRPAQRTLAKTVGFLSPTGGCGATMVACHFAHELARATSQSTLLADFDLLAGMVGFWMRSPNDYSIWDVVRAWQRLDPSMWRGLVSTIQPHLDVLNAPSEVVSDEVCDPEHLANVLEFGRSHYDWVVADLGSTLSPLSLRLVRQLNALFVVSTAELPALYQTKRVLHKLLALGYPRRRVRLVVNGVRRRQLEADEVAQALGWQVEAELPFDGAHLEEAQADGHLISRKSELGRRLAHLTARVLSERLEEIESLPVKGVSSVTALTRVFQQG